MDKVVALKTLSSEFYNGGIRLFELQTMRRIRDVAASSDHPGKARVMEFIHDFEHEAPTGKHVCLVFECLGPNLDVQMSKAQTNRLPYPTTKQVARQLLEAIDFLHNECSVLHTDINTSNILIDAQTNFAQKEARLGPAAALHSDVDIRIGDFGLACWVDEHLTDQIQPFVLRAPEITLGAPWEASVDLYGVGCLLYYFVTGAPPFQHSPTLESSASTTEMARLGMQIQTFGAVPDVVLANATRTKEFFDEDGELRSTSTSAPVSLEEQIIHPLRQTTSLMPKMPSEEVPLFCDFLRDILATDPRKRKSPKALLNHPWLQETESKSLSAG